MSIRYQIPKEDLKAEGFTHYGLFCGFVPVYIGDLHTDNLLVATRNWVPDFLMDVADFFYLAYCSTAKMADPLWESPGWPIRITGEI